MELETVREPFVGCDVVEIRPQYNGPGQIMLAATVAYEFLSPIARSRKVA